MQPQPREIYLVQKQQFTEALEQLQLKHNRFGWFRLALILATAVLGYQVFMAAGGWAWVVVFAGIALFLWLVSLDTENNRKISYHKKMVQVNSEELNILDGNIAHREGGIAYLPKEHPYAFDLDLLGTNSIYQMLNRCSGEQGMQMLAGNLLQPLPPDQIALRQEAVRELAPQYQWRQNLQAHAAANPLTQATEKKLLHWLSQPGTALNIGFWRWFVPVYTTVACGVAIAAIFELIPGSWFSLFFMAFILFAFTAGRKGTAVSIQLSGIVGQLETLQQVLQSVEQPLFNSPLLSTLQTEIGAGKLPASTQIKELKEILNRFDLRLNVFVFLFLNSFLLWDVRQLMALAKWRKANENKASRWFQVVANFEVLSSLATLKFNQPEWAEPQIDTHYFTFDALTLGHPLIREEQRVCSDFTMLGTGQVALITGSNMAGKSTFLRSMGVNTVLALMGAVVCARKMTISPVVLMSSMRIADNLAENTSTFYAELKKLKTIIEAVKAHQPVFILLDEILRGTNSLDRHTGSRALITQIIKENSVAVLATHDVELARMESQYPQQLTNYHFDVQVEGQELYFDYKLKTGVCTNLNASVLMQKIGIEL